MTTYGYRYGENREFSERVGRLRPLNYPSMEPPIREVTPFPVRVAEERPPVARDRHPQIMYREGDRVVHSRFGAGVVVAVHGSVEAKVDVQFDGPTGSLSTRERIAASSSELRPVPALSSSKPPAPTTKEPPAQAPAQSSRPASLRRRLQDPARSSATRMTTDNSGVLPADAASRLAPRSKSLDSWRADFDKD